ncbi:hypothetical protein BCF46_1060 [Litoreibacter meonggei]|uniref:Phosphoadenosine phosphosulfate reductase n=1 Tax=Litoreibacter meonggei TaxID=1049199 RepID=A0A497WQS6_9RHOB|nr:hypothetical protein BCF46_1060 [Litoreibacter meonggei]
MTDSSASDQDAQPVAETFRDTLSEIGNREGFFRDLGTEHSALFSQRGKTLVVTFENLDHVREQTDDQLPWGYSFCASKNWSMLGLMAHGWTWYRDPAVYDFFDELRDSGFFAQFDKVVFYGASMGAYAACAFASAAPGCDVIAISPQATLNRDVTSWETRYRKVWKRDFTNRYGFAPDQLRNCQKVTLFYDPSAQLDAMHAALFRADNIEKRKCRYMGHRIASLWALMGVLKPIVEGTIEGTLSEQRFYQLMRARHETPRYQKEMLSRLVSQQRHPHIVRLCRYVLDRRRAPHFRAQLRVSTQELKP